MAASRISKKLAKELKRLRLKKKFTQTQVARSIGVSLRYYQTIESKNPTRGLTLERLEKVGAVLGKKLHNF